jgi:3-isopropylmalate dehydrogenase
MLGAVGGPKWERVAPEIRPEAGLLKLRQALGLFANIRPIRVHDALVDASPLKPEIVRGVDLVIVRELTGGIYFGKPSERWESDEGRQAVDTLPYGEREIRRIAELAFKMAGPRRKKVTSVDKANVMATSRLWREVTTEVGGDFPEIALDHALVDSCAMRLISRPLDFDVMVMENMFGDILSDLMAGLVGGLGMAPAGNMGRNVAMFEAVHGSAPDIAGLGVANPTALILAAAMMLDHLEQPEPASRIRSAIVRTLADPEHRTGDLGGRARTSEFTAAVVRNLS